MKWKVIQTQSQIEEIIKRSETVPCLIFKHSTSCSISSVAKNRVEMNWGIPEETAEAYYLDLISYRTISNFIAERFQVKHESPQVLLIQNGVCTYTTSHLDITVEQIVDELSKAA